MVRAGIFIGALQLMYRFSGSGDIGVPPNPWDFFPCDMPSVLELVKGWSIKLGSVEGNRLECSYL